MDTPTPEWEIVAVQRHYEYLGLSDEQAARVALFEKETRNFMSGASQFSYWEEREYEWDCFRGLLSAEQWAVFEREWQANIQRYEVQLRSADATEWSKEAAVYEEMIGWYRAVFIPGCRKEALQSSLVPFLEREKIDYLRASYIFFLRRARQEALVNHYRQYRTYQPNGLRLALLRQELLHLWPDHNRFYREADAPTQAIAGFVLERYRGPCQLGADLFRRKSEEAEQQWGTVRIKHTGEPEIRGWSTGIREERWSAEELGMMALLLMEARPIG
jgi:hypothetical protein